MLVWAGKGLSIISSLLILGEVYLKALRGLERDSQMIKTKKIIEKTVITLPTLETVFQ